jgi:hypothetical protein
LAGKFKLIRKLCLDFLWYSPAFCCSQDRARQLLATDELSFCLNQLTDVAQRQTEVAARKKIEKMSEMPSKAGNSSEQRSDFFSSEDSQEDCIPEPPPALGSSEHAYSSKGTLYFFYYIKTSISV